VLVAAVVPLYVPQSRVGAWLSTHEYLKGMVAAGHTVRVCSFLAKGDPYEFEGVEVWRGQNHLEAVVKGSNVVVSHHGDNGVAPVLAKQRGIPSVRIFHADVPQVSRRTLQRNPPDLSVFVAEWMRDDLALPGRTVVVPSVVWPDEHRATPGGRVTLVNLCDDKGGKVFEWLARQMSDVRFLGVRGGYGVQREPRLPNVEYVGPTEDMKNDVWARTRILLMPSIREASGRAGIEALVSGIPVVCHPTPGLVETQGPTGIFVDRDNLRGWAAEIRRLLDPQVWAQKSQDALVRSAHFDPRVGIKRFVNAVEALV
jgi:hypothetical protein